MSKTLSREQVLALAEHVENAELQAHDITKVTNDFPDMTFEDAYDVQWEIRRRKEARGNKVVGMKMGLTSWAKMAQMGVDPPEDRGRDRLCHQGAAEGPWLPHWPGSGRHRFRDPRGGSDRFALRKLQV